MNEPRPAEFARFHELLTAEAPTEFEPYYFRVEAGSKAPALEFGSWKDDRNRLRFTEAIAWMRQGGNVGIAGTDEDRLVNVDIDDEDETSIDDLKPTLIGRTRSRTGMCGWYFSELSDAVPNITTDTAGEVRATWQYVVAPGSYVETDPATVPEDEQQDAGYYTIAREQPATDITLAELPEVFVDVHERNKVKRTQRNHQRTQTDDVDRDYDSESALYDIEASTVVENEHESTAVRDRWSSIFHGSDTDANMALTDRGLLQCWRHNVTHNGLQALVVLARTEDDEGDEIGNTVCADVGSPHANSGGAPSSILGEDGAIWDAWHYAKQHDYLPDDDPVPYRAVLHLCREMKVAASEDIPESYDPENDDRIPDYAYNSALSAIKNKYGLDPGREHTDRGEQREPASVEDAATEDDEDGETASTFATQMAQARASLREHKGPDGLPIHRYDGIDDAVNALYDELDFIYPSERTRGWREKLYVYADGKYVSHEDETGIYEPTGERTIGRITQRYLGVFGDTGTVRQIVDQCERYADTRARRLTEAPERLVVNNGVLDLETGEVDPHTPDEYHRTRIERTYDPAAECPAINAFLHEVVAEEDVDTLYQLIAHALYKDYPEDKAAMLLGDGANGKTIFITLVEKFLGEWNISGESLHDLADNDRNFSQRNLIGKLANTDPDMGNQTVHNMAVFKALTGRDTVSADVKYERPVRFKNHATMLFAANDIPVLDDDTYGNWRRWILLDFLNTFSPGDENYEPEEQLLDRLTTPEELDGLPARCVEEITDWHETDRAWFSNIDSPIEVRRRMRKASEPVFAFADDCLVRDPDSYLPKDDLMDLYTVYATRHGLSKLGKEQFSKRLLDLTEYDITNSRHRLESRGRVRTYDGVTLSAYGASLAGEDTSTPVAEDAITETEPAEMPDESGDEDDDTDELSDEEETDEDESDDIEIAEYGIANYKDGVPSENTSTDADVARLQYIRREVNEVLKPDELTMLAMALYPHLDDLAVADALDRLDTEEQ
jgi:putative DNA primase/helicase